jgi:hypothetical protein
VNQTDLETRTFIKTTEWAAITLTDARTVRRAIEAGQIPAVRICGAIRIPAEWARRQLRLGLDHESVS